MKNSEREIMRLHIVLPYRDILDAGDVETRAEKILVQGYQNDG